MTNALQDIIREPAELAGVLSRLTADNAAAIDEAVAAIDMSAPTYILGIGSSYNVAIAIATLFQGGGLPAFAVDASEMLHFMQIPKGANAIVLSRSGKSIEVVRLLEHLHKRKAHVVAITNTPDSPLAQQCRTVVHLGAAFDHNVSFTMYTALGLAGGLMAARARGMKLAPLADELQELLQAAAKQTNVWQQQIAESKWIAQSAPTYFLGRGTSVSSCHEARLLWEEVAKAPASALPTGGFRHGSQECIRPGVRVGLWLDPTVLNTADRGLIADLESVGASVMCIGACLDRLNATLKLEVPKAPKGWQFLVDIIPAQLASVSLAAQRGEDPDSFRFCSFVVEGEAGLSGKAA